MNEAETRAEHIDPALKEAGWGVVEGSRILREFRITEERTKGLGKPLPVDRVRPCTHSRSSVLYRPLLWPSGL